MILSVRPHEMSNAAAANGPMDMIIGILHTIRSVNPPRGQWPAPMGSWRVTHAYGCGPTRRQNHFRGPASLNWNLEIMIDHD